MCAGLVVAGLSADGRQLWHRAREEAQSYLKHYGVSIPLGVLAERIALFMHAFTLYWHVRPFGATCILGGLQKDPLTGYQELKGISILLYIYACMHANIYIYILLYFSLFYFTLFCFILFYPVLFCFISFCFILF